MFESQLKNKMQVTKKQNIFVPFTVILLSNPLNFHIILQQLGIWTQFQAGIIKKTLYSSVSEKRHFSCTYKPFSQTFS